MGRSSLINTSALVRLALLAIFCMQTPMVAEGGFWDDIQGTIGQMGTGDVQQSVLTNTDIIAGLKDALRVGSDHVVNRLGAANGFNKDARVHIPLPDTLKSVQSALSQIGMSSMVDDLELKLNRAAEAATPKAKQMFMDAIYDMSLDDAKGILNGPKDAATRYFQRKMSPSLANEMQPIVSGTLAEVGAIKAYDSVMGQYSAIPFMPDVKANLTEHVIRKGMDGIFYYLAVEEAAIRKDPAKRTTEILKKVFGSK